MARVEDRGGRMAWLAGLALAGLIVCLIYGAAAVTQTFSEPDNAMRLVSVRDVLSGRGWFDSLQPRLNPPEGVLMHWAQWIDAVLAMMCVALAPILGQTGAEIAIAFIWPLGLLSLFMWLLVRIAGEMAAADGLRAQAQWAAAMLGALAFPAIDKFAPAAFDHHNVVLVASLAGLLGLMEMARRPLAGALAGAVLAFGMATAAEGAPMAAAGLGAAGLLWLARPGVFGRGLFWFGAGLGATSLVMLGVSLAPQDWGRATCDAMGGPFAGFGLAGGLIAMTLSRLPGRLKERLSGRMLTGLALGALAGGVLIAAFPACLSGGYGGLSAQMRELWMAQISEARPLGRLLFSDPAVMAALAGAALTGLLAGIVYILRSPQREEGWIVMAFLGLSVLLMTWQIRSAAFASAFALPFGAWAVAAARRAFYERPGLVRALSFSAIACASAAAAWAGGASALQSALMSPAQRGGYEARLAGSQACGAADSLAPLKALPRAVFLNTFSTGAGVLAASDHSVLAAPYHRNASGLMTMIQAMRAGPAEARERVLGSAASHVLICPDLPEMAFYAAHPAPGVAPADTLAARLTEGRIPDWLAPVDLGASPLRVYRILR